VHVGNRILFHIDDEGTVTQVGVGYHGEHRTIDCFHMTVKFDDGRSGRLTVVTPDAQPALDSLLNNMALEAKKDKTKWGAFWAVNNAFHRVSYSYALTVHRAQGSTYKNVLVDRQDILRNVDEYDALRCLYVAYSRPTKILVTN
jgi:exodeoxyribonuclease-5